MITGPKTRCLLVSLCLVHLPDYPGIPPFLSGLCFLCFWETALQEGKGEGKKEKKRKKTPTFYLLPFILFDEGLACECNSTTRCIKTVIWLIRQAVRASRTPIFSALFFLSAEMFMGVLFVARGFFKDNNFTYSESCHNGC